MCAAFRGFKQPRRYAAGEPSVFGRAEKAGRFCLSESKPVSDSCDFSFVRLMLIWKIIMAGKTLRHLGLKPSIPASSCARSLFLRPERQRSKSPGCPVARNLATIPLRHFV
jgi:hypothetical protein